MKIHPTHQHNGISAVAFGCICCFFLLFSFFATAQDTQTKRPKVGLVLSGGGAKGFAHIGVLKVLEEAGVQVDYIGGTSMGAIIGGLYASGYNAKQIDSIFTDTDFDALLSDFIPRTSKNFYEKRNDEMYAFTLPFNKMRIGIPTAISRGMYNYNLLNKLTANVRHVRDFNQLPIPFLCVATDVETGEEVLLNKGYLAQALLASGAFPTLFSPVEVDGRWLVDGGVTNNFPVEEIKKLGADIIIGVDVQDDLKDRKSLQDATKILGQISNLQMIEQMKEKIKLTDIYLKPDINDYGVISFDLGSEIVKKGEEAAYAAIDQIKKIAQPVKGKPAMSVCKDTLHIRNILLNPLDNYTRSYVIGKLRFKQGQSISYEDLRNGMDNITATQNFSAIGYSLEKADQSAEDDLHLHLTENPTTTFLKFALHYDGLYKSAVLVNVTQKKTLLKNDILSADLILGDNVRYNFDYYIDNGFYWSYGFKSRLNRFARNVETDFDQGELLAQLALKNINIRFSDFTNQLYAQTIFAQKFLLGVGIELKHLKISSETLENVKPVLENSDYGSVFGYLKYDSFDNKYFPETGWYFLGDFQSYLYSSDYNNMFERFSIAKGDIGFARQLFRKATVKIQAEAGFAIGGKSAESFDFIIGGYGYNMTHNFRHFYGYDFLSIAGDSYIKSALTFDYEIFKKHHVNLSANIANIKDNLFETADWISRISHTGYAAGYGLETLVGPVELKYSWSPEVNKGFFWINVGFWF
ncbi:patatin-like phospholipase family protein [Flavobacterium caeni]|uniref:NTE family protein n=1 Tax=Flavobacterium caeni TaxID=490189 RepID=A0A1G5H066_9FLAO|nr:patatin-like phospholipase family protein [Flavobacterium caeni]SCY57081.1 NTE family protein [Flavobacterium caeni]